MNALTELFGDPISIYTREQAIEDGILIDVTTTAREAGFRVPVAMTAALYADVSRIFPDVSFQSVAGRLWDVLWMAVMAAKGIGEVRAIDECTCLYSVILYTEPGQFKDGGSECDLPKYRVKMVSGPGDEGEHVITLMKPEED
jgi:hypothetical protein